MEYQISILPRAERNLRLIYTDVNAEHSVAAQRWYRKLRRSIRALRNNPNRCPVTHENRELRHLLFGHKPHIYRVIFRVFENQKSVVVLHVRHAARRELMSVDVM
jgi:toxin ParE1/3/4